MSSAWSVIPRRPPRAGHRQVRRPFRHPDAPHAFLQRDRPALDRPRADDPDAADRLLPRHAGRGVFTYSTNYLIDVETALIVDVEARSRQQARLRCRRSETSLRSEHAGPKKTALDP